MSDDAPHKVSPNNPCPFLRALVAEGLLDDRGATIGDATEMRRIVGRMAGGKIEPEGDIGVEMLGEIRARGAPMPD